MELSVAENVNCIEKKLVLQTGYVRTQKASLIHIGQIMVLCVKTMRKDGRESCCDKLRLS